MLKTCICLAAGLVLLVTTAAAVVAQEADETVVKGRVLDGDEEAGLSALVEVVSESQNGRQINVCSGASNDDGDFEFTCQRNGLAVTIRISAGEYESVESDATLTEATVDLGDVRLYSLPDTASGLTATLLVALAALAAAFALRLERRRRPH